MNPLDSASPPDETWAVYRQDDNGHQFVVQTGLSREDAERLVEQFTARGHKQTYTAGPEQR